MPSSMFANFQALSKSASRHMDSSSNWGDNGILFTSLGAIAVFWAGLYFWDKYRKHQARQAGNPNSLFLELCNAHKLNRTERALLWHATQAFNPQQAALVFVDSRIVGKLADSSDSQADAYGCLAAKLFGDKTE